MLAGKKGKDGVNWEQVAQSSDFRELIKTKKKFIIPYVIFFMVFYFTLPISTSYFTILNDKVIGSLNWAYLFAFAQFIMTWVLCLIYVKKANQFDKAVEQVKAQAGAGQKPGDQEVASV
jgi:uncharacterized membrane protein (DUF485 family)